MDNGYKLYLSVCFMLLIGIGIASYMVYDIYKDNVMRDKYTRQADMDFYNHTVNKTLYTQGYVDNFSNEFAYSNRIDSLLKLENTLGNNITLNSLFI